MDVNTEDIVIPSRTKSHLFFQIVLGVIVIVLAVGCGLYIKSLKKGLPERSLKELVRHLHVMRVEEKQLSGSYVGYGVARPIRKVGISSEVKGRVIYVHPDLKVGRYVKKGEVLVKIDDVYYRLLVAQSKATLAQLGGELKLLKQDVVTLRKELDVAKRDYKLEQDDFTRATALFEHKVINKRTYTRAKQSLNRVKKSYLLTNRLLNKSIIQQESFKAQIEKANAVIKYNEENVLRSVIKAPFTGRLTMVDVELGEYAQMGKRVLAIADDSSLEIPISVYIKEAFIFLDGSLHGKDHWVSVKPSVKATICWGKRGGEEHWEGIVKRVEKVDEKNHTVTFIVSPKLDNKQRIPLLSGMFCEVTLTGGELKGLIRIPLQAIQFDNDVFVMNSKNRLEQRHVTITRMEGNDVFISSGLHSGDVVVTQRVDSSVVNGVKIHPIFPKSGKVE